MLCTFAPPLFSPCDSCHPHVLCLCSAHLHHLTHSPCHPSRAVTMTMTLQSPIEHYGHLDLGNKYIFPAVQYTCTLACCGTRSISLESKGNKLSQVSLIWLMSSAFTEDIFTVFLVLRIRIAWLYLQGKFAVNRRSYRFSPRWLMSRV